MNEIIDYGTLWLKLQVWSQIIGLTALGILVLILLWHLMMEGIENYKWKKNLKNKNK